MNKYFKHITISNYPVIAMRDGTPALETSVLPTVLVWNHTQFEEK
jgi:hypothetical protein